MRRISKLLIAILCTLLSFEPVRAETDNLTGQWKQISSNAGNCSNCFIGIMKHGRIFTISANNHWTATLEVESYGPARYAFGEGNGANDRDHTATRDLKFSSLCATENSTLS